MNYLEVVNKVLLRLREPSVSTVQGSANSNTYARLIGEFVNEAKGQVEAAWDWGSLRTTLTARTTTGLASYELQGVRNSITMLSVFNDTDNIEMQYRDGAWFNNAFLAADPERGSPAYYNFNGVSADGDILVDIYPVPDKLYEIRFNGTVRNLPLVNDGDILQVPFRPVILLATAMAIEERGEDGGQSSINAYAMAKSALADEIALDSARHPENTIWYAA